MPGGPKARRFSASAHIFGGSRQAPQVNNLPTGSRENLLGFLKREKPMTTHNSIGPARGPWTPNAAEQKLLRQLAHPKGVGHPNAAEQKLIDQLAHPKGVGHPNAAEQKLIDQLEK